jgi:hypothetical protein
MESRSPCCFSSVRGGDEWSAAGRCASPPGLTALGGVLVLITIALGG